MLAALKAMSPPAVVSELLHMVMALPAVTEKVLPLVFAAITAALKMTS
jgi:hypothetical protein